MKNNYIDFNNLEKSLFRILNSQYNDLIKLYNIKLFFHAPAKRFYPSFILTFSLNPEKIVFFLSKDIEKSFINEFLLFKKWVVSSFIQKLPLNIKNNYIKFAENIEFIKLKNHFNIPDEFYNLTLQITKNNINSFYKNKPIKNPQKEVIIDVTGGTKIHAILLHKLSLELNTSYSYLSVYEKIPENNKQNTITVEYGSEELLIGNRKKGSFEYFSFDEVLNLSISENQIRMFYNETYISKSIKFNNHLYKNIKENIKKLNYLLPKHTKFMSEQMLTPIIDKIKNDLISFLSHDIYDFISNYKGKIIKIIIDENTYNFPLEFLFDSNKFFIVKHFAISISKKNDLNFNYKQNKKTKMLILYSINHDKYFVDSLNLFKEILKKYENLIDIYFFNMNSKNNYNYINKTDWDIIHYVGHTDLDSKGMYIPIYNNSNNISYNKIYYNDKRILLKSKFIFFNSCFSANMEIPLQKSFLYNFYYNSYCKVFIGNRWNIRTNTVYNFNKYFYEYILEGKTIGESFFLTLSKLQNPILSLNYIFFGNPKYKIE